MNVADIKPHSRSEEERSIFGGTATWLTPTRFAAALALMICFSFPGVLLRGRVFIFRDFGLFGYPLAYFHRASFWRGELPFWNPLNHCGLPFLAQWNTLTLYPLSLIYLLLPMPWSVSFFCLAHQFLAGLGMYFLARNWTRNSLAAGLAGVIFSFNGLALNALMWPNIIATLGCLPWVVWLMPEGWRQGREKMLWGVLAASMQMLAGGPEPIFFTWVILFALMCVDWFRTRGYLQFTCKKWAIPLRFLVMGLLVFLICAPQLLPFLELLKHSQRNIGFGAASHDWSIPFWGWANFLVPLFRTSPTPQGVFLQNGQYWTSSYYAGIGTVFLALVALRRLGDWRILTVAGLGLTALVLAWGDGTLLYRALTFCFPEMGFVRYPVKFVILALAVVPLVAASGLKSLLSKGARTGRFEWVCGIAILLLLAVILRVDWNAPIPHDAWTATLKSGLSRGGFLILVFALIAVFRRRILGSADQVPRGSDGLKGTGRGIQPSLRDLGAAELDPTLKRWAILRCPSGTGLLERTGELRGIHREVLFGTALLLVFWLDLITQVPTQNPTVPGSVYRPGWARQQLHWDPEPALGQSRVMTSSEAHRTIVQTWLADPEQNYLRNRLACEMNCNLLDNTPHVDGFYSLVPGEMYEIAGLFASPPSKGIHPVSEGAQSKLSGLLDFLGVSEITAPGTLTNWTARPNFMPMVTAGQRIVFADDKLTLDALSKKDVDLGHVVYLPLEAQSLVPPTGATSACVTNIEYSNNKISFETVSHDPSMVVISQTTYPSWKAYVDGRPAELWHANYAFQAVRVPAGTHQVLLRYEDRAFLAGAGLSMLGIALCAWACLRSAGKRGNGSCLYAT